MTPIIGQGRWDRDAIAYFARVQADGGVIISDVDVNNAIKHAKAYGYWSSVVFWTSAQFGVKKDGSNAVSKLYCLKGNDAAQTTGSAQPIWTANQQNGKSVIDYAYSTIQSMSITALNTFQSFDCAYISIINPVSHSTDFGTILGRDVSGNINSMRFGISSNYLVLSSDGTNGGVTGTTELLSTQRYVCTGTISSDRVIKLYINGNKETNESTFANYSVLNSPIAIGTRLGDGQRHFIGDMTEHIILSSCPSDSIRVSIESQLNSRYAIY